MCLKKDYIFKSFTVITGIFILSGALYLFLTDYEYFVRSILSQTGKSDKINKFKTEYLSYEKFLVLRFTAVFINIIFWFLFFKYYKTIETKIIDFLQFIVSGIKNEIRSISKKDWKFLELSFSLLRLLKFIIFLLNQLPTMKLLLF